MAGFSYGVLGLLLMLDIMFLTNYFIVRALRKWADAIVDTDATRLKDDEEGGKNVEYKASCFETVLFGWVLGKVKPDKLSIHRFPEWKPVPLFLGVTSTSILVIIALAMLTPQFLSASFDLQIGGGSLNGNLCDVDTQNSTLTDLNNTLKEMTNFDLALRQHSVATQMTPLLQDDVTLYGEEGHGCPPTDSNDRYVEGAEDQFALDGKKVPEWDDINTFPAAKWGTFFPGYCRAKTDAEVKLAELKVCGPREVCICPRVPDVFPVNIIGSWVGKEVCAMKVCFEFDNIPCGELTTDDIPFPPNNYRAQQMNHTATLQQQEMEEQEFPHVATEADMGTGIAETFTKIMGQIDLASNVYSLYACLSLYFPGPLDAFRLPYTIAAKNFTFGAQKGVFMIMVIAIWWLYDKLSGLLQSPEIQLFLNNLRAGDPCFLVCIHWIVLLCPFTSAKPHSKFYQDGEYIVKRQDLLANICNALLPLEPEVNVAVNTTTNIINEVEIFVDPDCGCAYPGVNLKAMSTGITEFSQALMKSIGFTRTVPGVDAFLPEEGTQFIGNKTICEDSEMAREIVLQAPETTFSGYELWIESGLFATIILKFSMANFVIALLKIADPFVVCAGRFVWIPAKFGLSMDGLDKDQLFNQFKTTKESSLFYINLRGAIFWGLTMHWALWNLMSTAYTTSLSDGGVSEDDVSILKLSMSVAAIVVATGILIICCLKSSGKRARKRKGKMGDDDNDGDAESGGESDGGESDDSFNDEEST
mmetsp:Transcript_28241/g.46773  ORF Transcript_28241/g.46773 Transcript_28241/m.46773 type:complete len:757 (+) Transcript_28241:223-2493(+)|eukprot:CAMPEP_0119005558 /NCGR_PEP_ID=MMETSP1176-20130426/1796_1 /TAXON_ID=265551 /ORGANISM="Synedropsis recta cf, Strain CCMP1620" /LENGTH=756 /DNA_ID=CAMNT_0006957387 /DNA_START=153 /DNA_END=2423 /DNA_ORIENTATION=+